MKPFEVREIPVIAPELSTEVTVKFAPAPGQFRPHSTLNTVPFWYPLPPDIKVAEPIPLPERYVPLNPEPPPPVADKFPSP